jgi:hypothetical protein
MPRRLGTSIQGEVAALTAMDVWSAVAVFDRSDDHFAAVRAPPQRGDEPELAVPRDAMYRLSAYGQMCTGAYAAMCTTDSRLTDAPVLPSHRRPRSARVTGTFVIMTVVSHQQ